jgi:hypothetical protein
MTQEWLGTIVVAIMGGLTTALSLVYRNLISVHTTQLSEQRVIFQAALTSQQAAFQEALNLQRADAHERFLEWRERDTRQTEYLSRQADTLTTQTELLRALHREIEEDRRAEKAGP